MGLSRLSGIPRATVVVVLSCAIGTGCAAVLKQHSYDFKTTALFRKPCDVAAKPEPPRPLESASSMAFQSASIEADPTIVVDPQPSRTVQTDAACNSAYLVTMVEKFMTIREADELAGIPGDTIEGVRQKGFSIYRDAAHKLRRQNTKPLYGADALAAIGMGVSSPPLQRPEDIKAYTEYMGQHYGEEYHEKDMMNVTDRFCLNRRESLELGDDRVFVIVWRSGHVIKRIIRGGPVNNPKQDSSFLVCPTKFILDTVTGRVSNMIPGVTP